MNQLRAVLFDLDGVIFHGTSLIPGAKESVYTLQDAGIPYRFITNMTRMTKNNLVKMLGSMGFSIDSDTIFAAPHAAVEYCKLKGYRKISLIVPDRDMEQDFSSFQLVNTGQEAIVLGDMGDNFTPKLLNHIFNQILNGAVLVAMHKNRYWKSTDKYALDLGAFVSALEYASGKPAVIMGKPNPNLFRLASQSWNISADEILVIGDDIEADISGAKNAGMKSALVKTGKYRENNLKQSKIQPDYLINSIADLLPEIIDSA